MRRAARTDANHAGIVEALRQIGCAVQSLATVGGGCPDLLVRAPDMRLVLLEVKDGAKRASARRLTPDQVQWHQQWGAPVAVVLDVQEAIAAVMGAHWVVDAIATALPRARR